MYVPVLIGTMTYMYSTFSHAVLKAASTGVNSHAATLSGVGYILLPHLGHKLGVFSLRKLEMKGDL